MAESSKIKLQQRTAWYAVSIVPGKPCCMAVLAFSSTRWLCAEAPRFPVLGCDAKICDCRYSHHADRRAKTRRRYDRDGMPSRPQGVEHRSSRRGRRDSDV